MPEPPQLLLLLYSEPLPNDWVPQLTSITWVSFLTKKASSKKKKPSEKAHEMRLYPKLLELPHLKNPTHFWLETTASNWMLTFLIKIHLQSAKRRASYRTRINDASRTTSQFNTVVIHVICLLCMIMFLFSIFPNCICLIMVNTSCLLLVLFVQLITQL